MKKLKSNHLYFIFTLLVLSTINSQAAQILEHKEEVKCYVEITGSFNTISFWKVSVDKLKTLPSYIQGKKILAPNVGKKYANITNVYECVLLSHSFSTIEARNLDRIMPR